MDNTTKMAIGAAGLLLLVALVGLAVTTKDRVDEIEGVSAERQAEAAKKQQEESKATRLMVGVIAGALVLGMGFIGFRFVKQYLAYRSTPPAPKEPWQKYT